MFPQIDDPPEGEQGVPRRASLATRVGFVALSSVALVVLFWSPQLLKTVKVRPAIPIEGLQGQVSGTYVDSEKGFYKLFAYPIKVSPYPDETAVAAPDAVVYVRARQLLDDLSLYTLHTYGDGKEVAAQRRLLDQHTIELVPERPLTPGRYYMWVTRDSVDAGFDYAFFSVAPSTAAVAGQQPAANPPGGQQTP